MGIKGRGGKSGLWASVTPGPFAKTIGGVKQTLDLKQPVFSLSLYHPPHPPLSLLRRIYTLVCQEPRQREGRLASDDECVIGGSWADEGLGHGGRGGGARQKTLGEGKGGRQSLPLCIYNVFVSWSDYQDKTPRIL